MGDCAARALAHVHAWGFDRNHPNEYDYQMVTERMVIENVPQRRDGSYAISYGKIAEHIADLSQFLPGECALIQTFPRDVTLADAFDRFGGLLVDASRVVVAVRQHMFPVTLGRVCDGSYANARLLGLWVWSA